MKWLGLVWLALLFFASIPVLTLFPFYPFPPTFIHFLPPPHCPPPSHAASLAAWAANFPASQPTFGAHRLQSHGLRLPVASSPGWMNDFFFFLNGEGVFVREEE